MNKNIVALAKLLLKAEQKTNDEFRKSQNTPLLERSLLAYETAQAEENALRDKLVAHVLWAVQFGKESEADQS